MFKSMFSQYSNVEVVLSDFKSFMKENHDTECIVSPANSYGVMKGGYDAAISDYLGWDFQERVQQYIKDNFYGEQHVETSFIIDTPKNKRLKHTSIMILPEIIVDDRVVYQTMRATLICVLENNVKSILIPLFDAGTGQVHLIIVCKHMINAYKQIIEAENGNYIWYFNN